VFDAFEVFQTMREVKSIYPDANSLSTLLKMLKLMFKSQLMMPSHPLHLQQAQSFLIQITTQLKYSQHLLYSNPIILNSYMDMCVKL
jgi:hypothetical protein